MKEYISQLKSFDFYSEFKVGYYLDALDEHKWKVAKIKEISKYGLRTTIELRFDGYSSRFDTGYDLPSSHKLAPFRTHTLPYTGPGTIEPKRDQPPQKFSAYLKELTKITADRNCEKLKSGLINQFLRGELFIIADYIITKRSFEKDFEEASNFLFGYIKEGCKILNYSVQYLKEFQKQHFDPSLYNVHPKIALLLSNTQFLFIVNTIINNKDSRSEIQRNYEKWVSHQINFAKKIKQLILEQKVLVACERIMEFKAANGRGLPWSLKKEVCLIMNQLKEGYIFPTPTDHKEIIEVLDYMGYLSNKGLLQREQEEKKTLSLIVSLIIGGNFEGRLRGLNELKKILDYYMRKKDYICAQIQQTGLLTFLIDNKNFNPQIFKRSLPLFQFCYSNKLLGKKELLQIIGLHKDKHQLQLKSFYSSLSQFPAFLEHDTIVSFLKDIINSLPLNQLLINLIKDYTLTAESKNSYFRQNYCKEGYELGLSFYWGLITSDRTDISSQLKYKLTEAFASLLGNIYYSKQVEKYFSASLTGIANRKNLEYYFKIIHETLKISKNARITKSIEAIEREVNIVDCVIEGLQNPSAISNKIWECMFEFLEEVTYISKKKLTFFQIKAFWSIRQCRTYLLKLLRKFRLKGEEDKNHQKIINKQLALDTMKQVISKLFLDGKQMQDYQNISPQVYQTADELIICYNHQGSKAFEYNYKHTLRVRNIDSAFGLEFYQSIINQCKQPEIVDKAIHRFIQFHIRVKEGIRNFESAKLSNWNYILQKLSKLKRNVLLSYSILLEDICGRMKSLNILQPDPTNLIVLNKATGVKRLMSVPRYTSFWKLRHLIGKQFDMPNLNFEMQYTTSSYNQIGETNFQKEEDFSMALITLAKDGPSVMITPTKSPRHPHLETLDQFYRAFADQKGDELFEWLSKGDQQTRRILEILNKLPFIKKVQQKLLRISSKEMNDTLDSTCLLKLNYQLKIITNEKNPKLAIAMIQKGYIPHIAKILTNRENYKNEQSYKILTGLMGFLTELIKFAKMVKNIAPLFFNDTFLVQLFHINKTISEEYLSFLSKSFSLLREVAGSKELLAATGLKPGIVFQSKSFEKAFQLVILNKTKQKNGEIFVDLARLTNSQPILLNISNKLLKSSQLFEKQLTCGGLFDVISGFIDKKIPSVLIDNIKSFSRQIRASDVMQTSQEIENELLIGYMSLILKAYKTFSKQELFEDLIGQKLQKFINFIINDCLFNLEDPKKIKFKSPALRCLGYSLIQQFQYEKSGSKLSNAIMKSLKMGQSWRRQDEWSISPVKQISHKFTGLKNLAATCYINSLLQQLYFIDNFRDQLIGVDAQTIEDKQNIVLQIQNIFAHLKYSETPVYTTASLCKKFILDGQPIDPRVQTDVDEFFHSLMDKLERNLNKINKKDIINHIFGGELSNLIVGSACQHTSERIQPFLSIRLEIKDKKSLEQALKQFIKGEVLEGDNAYFCERCDAKVKAVKRVCLKTLPQILIVTLKRFQFDYQTMQKFKLNTYCSFPNVLNVLPYTRAGLDKEFQPEKQQFEYRLKGVVIHYGISEAGHYTSYVQAESEKWYYFDDEKITQFNGQQLGNEAFGGIQENPFGDDQDKKKNAYLLFYEKIKKTVLTKVQDLAQAPIMKEIKQENVRNGLVNILFQPQMQNYIYSIFTEKQDPKLFLTYFHLIFLRSSRRREKLELFYSAAEFMLKGNKDYSQWYLSQINETFLYEFIFYAQVQIRLLVTSLIIEAIKANQDFHIAASVLEQICAFIGKKNLVPAYKIVTSVIKSKSYEKYLRDIGLAEIIMHFLRNPNKQIKILKNLQLKIKRQTNQFGYGNSSFIDRPLLIDQIDLIQCIESFKVTISLEQLDILIKRAKKQKTQESLAIITARKYSESDSYAKIQALVMQNLCQLQCNHQDEHVYTFYIYLLEQLAAVNDPSMPKKVERLATIYLKAMNQSISGFRSELLLLLGLFKICGSNLAFRDKISDLFQEKDWKKLLKDIKNWIKEASIGVGTSIRSGKMGYWRKSQLKSMNYQTLNFLIETDDKVNAQKMLAALNAICEKHNTFFNTSGQRFVKDELVKFGRDKCKFIRNFGLMAQISYNDAIRIVNYQDLVKAQYTT